ncbi:MAG: GatB/YqeY domain-containing protein, partial [candidate division Zixibacteria bacterium]|nr:GatB/YqeY domain-containing protein [candidate division Zixibacteria bacterium]
MSLKQRIEQDMKLAQKSGDKLKLSLTRLLKSDIRYKEIEKGKELSDEEVLEVLSSSAKKHWNSIEQFKKGGREDLVKREEEELNLIRRYMTEFVQNGSNRRAAGPAQFIPEKIEKLVEEPMVE